MVLLRGGVSTQDPYLFGRGIMWLPSKHARFYATKDGEDLSYKTKQVSKIGLKLGSAAAAFDILVRTTPTSVKQVGFRYLQIAIPATLMGVAFSSGVVISANLLHADRALNHFVGGVSAGAVLGAATGSVKWGSLTAVVIGSLAALTKECYKYDINMVGAKEIPRYHAVGFHGQVGRTWDPWRKEYDIEDLYKK